MAQPLADFWWEMDDNTSPMAGQGWPELRATFPGMSFHCPTKWQPVSRIAGLCLGPGKLYRIVSNLSAGAQDLGTTPQTEAMFALAIPIDGGMVVTQSGRQCSVAAQSACLIDMTRSFHIEHPGVTTQLVLQVPRDILLGRYPHFGRFTTRPFDEADPGTALLRDLLLRSLSYIPTLDESQRTSLFWVVLGMLGLPKISADETEWRVQKALAFIRAHLTDEKLSAHAVARAQAISRRSLDELFCRVRGRSVAAEIADLRLVLASEALRDPSQARRTIGDIAFHVGFEHPAHFTRAFGKRFGVTPRDWRGGAVDQTRGRSHVLEGQAM